VQDFWYADHLDLIKWGILLRLADSFCAKRVLQLAFNPRTEKFDRLRVGDQEHDIPAEVIAHFRDLRKILGVSTRVAVAVFDPPFTKNGRESHCRAACAFLSDFSHERCVVLLDPDTGLEPQKPTLKHVLKEEAGEIWEAMKAGDVFALFQHKTNMAGLPWLETKREQLAAVLGITPQAVKLAHAVQRAKTRPSDPVVAILYAQRPPQVSYLCGLPLPETKGTPEVHERRAPRGQQ